MNAHTTTSTSVQPPVVIGMPVRNGERYLGDSVRSLLAQTFPDFRLIIADNASTDSTEEICREFARQDPRVEYTRHAENIGAAPNFNYVFRAARGRYFKWAAHDDICEPEFLARCVERLEADERAAICHCYSYWFDRDGKVISPAEMNPAVSGSNVAGRMMAALETGYPTLIWGVMRRDAAAATRLMASFVNSDRYFLGELLMRGRAEIVPEYLFGVRRHEESFSEEFYRVSPKLRSAWFDPRMRMNGLGAKAATMARMGRLIATAPMPAAERAACVRYLGWRVGDVVKRRVSRQLGIGDGRRPPRRWAGSQPAAAALPALSMAARMAGSGERDLSRYAEGSP